jgi:hypothetical protein
MIIIITKKEKGRKKESTSEMNKQGDINLGESCLNNGRDITTRFDLVELRINDYQTKRVCIPHRKVRGAFQTQQENNRTIIQMKINKKKSVRTLT